MAQLDKSRSQNKNQKQQAGNNPNAGREKRTVPEWVARDDESVSSQNRDGRAGRDLESSDSDDRQNPGSKNGRDSITSQSHHRADRISDDDKSGGRGRGRSANVDMEDDDESFDFSDEDYSDSEESNERQGRTPISTQQRRELDRQNGNSPTKR